MRTPYIFITIRVTIGLLYLISGAQKLLQPYENFVYVIQSYDIIHHAGLERIIAWVFPWVEYLMGGFLLLGLWTRIHLIGIGIFSSVFIIIVGQAMLRHLPIQECGCFGDLVGVPLWGTFMIDVITLFAIIVVLKFLEKDSAMSLDFYLKKRA